MVGRWCSPWRADTDNGRERKRATRTQGSKIRAGRPWPDQLPRQLFLKRRFAIPLIAGVLLLAVINEVNYRQAHSTLVGGIALTDAHRRGNLLQLLTDAETAACYLLTKIRIHPAAAQARRLVTRAHRFVLP
jgi:hypothetical protein